MAKLQEVTIWYVTLPNGKKVEIEKSIAEQYFRSSYAATPFSHLKLHRVTKKVKVEEPPRRRRRTSVTTRKKKVVRKAAPKRSKTVSRRRTKVTASRRKK